MKSGRMQRYVVAVPRTPPVRSSMLCGWGSIKGVGYRNYCRQKSDSGAGEGGKITEADPTARSTSVAIVGVLGCIFPILT